MPALKFIDDERKRCIRETVASENRMVAIELKPEQHKKSLRTSPEAFKEDLKQNYTG